MKKLLLLTALGLGAFAAQSQAISDSFEGYPFDDSNNLWKTATVTASWANLTNGQWGAITPQPEITVTDGGMSVNIPSNAGWEAWQVQIKLQTDITVYASKQYDFSAIVNSTKSSDNVLFKLYTGDDNVFFTGGNDRVTIPEGQSCYFFYDQPGIDGDVILLLDLPNLAGAEFSLSNIVLREHVEDSDVPAGPTYLKPETVPSPSQDASDVLSLFSSKYPAATKFAVAYDWGAPTSIETITIDNQSVYFVKNFSWEGWTLNPALNVSEYDYLHLDYWTPEGKTLNIYPIAQSEEGATQDTNFYTASNLSNSDWNEINVPLSDFQGKINLNKIFQFKVDNAGGVYGYITNIYFYKSDNTGGNEPSTGEGNGATYTGKAEGVCTNAYLAGQEPSDATDIPVIVNYSVTWLENGNLLCKVNSIEPSTIVGMVPKFNYNGVKDLANNEYTLEGDFKEGDTVNFSWYLAYAGGANDVNVTYTVGSSNSGEEGGDNPGDSGDDDDALTFTVNDVKYTVDWSATWNTDEKVTISLTISPSGLAGISPQLFVDGAYEGDFIGADGGTWTYVTKNTYQLGDKPKFALFVAYAGGATAQMPLDYTVTGDTTAISSFGNADVNAPVEYFNLQGVKVANPQHGIFIRRQGNKTTKVIL